MDIFPPPYAHCLCCCKEGVYFIRLSGLGGGVVSRIILSSTVVFTAEPKSHNGQHHSCCPIVKIQRMSKPPPISYFANKRT